MNNVDDWDNRDNCKYDSQISSVESCWIYCFSIAYIYGEHFYCIIKDAGDKNELFDVSSTSRSIFNIFAYPGGLFVIFYV